MVSDSVFGSSVGLTPSASETTEPSEAAARTLPELFRAHYPAVWRLLRRFGVQSARLDDAAQEVFWVAARRFEDILPGREKAFLYGVALRVASNELRRAQADAEAAYVISEAVRMPGEVAPSPEESLEQRRALALLDAALARLPIELRSVLVLFELEGLEVSKIAEIEGIPLGTASSRLRRARVEFAAIAKRLRAALRDDGRAR